MFQASHVSHQLKLRHKEYNKNGECFDAYYSKCWQTYEWWSPNKWSSYIQATETNIEKCRSLFLQVSAAIRLNFSGAIANRGDTIQYVHTDSSHTEPLQRITPTNLISSKEYDKEKYLDMLLDSAEAVLSIFGFNRSLFGFDKRNNIGGMRFIISVKEILKQQDQNYELRYCCQEWQCLALASVSLGY